MGIILLVARVFDAFNDPFMGRHRSQDQDQMGKFRPLADDRHGDQCRCSVSDVLGTACTEWQWTGSLCCSHLYSLGRDLYHDGYSLLVHDTGIYSQRKEREGLSTLGRSCAGVGSAIITVITMLCVNALGGGEERVGFSRFTLIIAVLFVIFVPLPVLISRKNLRRCGRTFHRPDVQGVNSERSGDGSGNYHCTDQLRGLYLQAW